MGIKVAVTLDKLIPITVVLYCVIAFIVIVLVITQVNVKGNQFGG